MPQSVGLSVRVCGASFWDVSLHLAFFRPHWQPFSDRNPSDWLFSYSVSAHEKWNRRKTSKWVKSRGRTQKAPLVLHWSFKRRTFSQWQGHLERGNWELFSVMRRANILCITTTAWLTSVLGLLGTNTNHCHLLVLTVTSFSAGSERTCWSVISFSLCGVFKYNFLAIIQAMHGSAFFCACFLLLICLGVY